MDKNTIKNEMLESVLRALAPVDGAYSYAHISEMTFDEAIDEAAGLAGGTGRLIGINRDQRTVLIGYGAKNIF